MRIRRFWIFSFISFFRCAVLASLHLQQVNRCATFMRVKMYGTQFDWCFALLIAHWYLLPWNIHSTAILGWPCYHLCKWQLVWFSDLVYSVTDWIRILWQKHRRCHLIVFFLLFYWFCAAEYCCWVFGRTDAASGLFFCANLLAALQITFRFWVITVGSN